MTKNSNTHTEEIKQMERAMDEGFAESEKRCRDCGKYIRAINTPTEIPINPKKRYSPRFIGTYTFWILNSAGKPSHQFVLNEIKMGSLKAIPVPPKGVKKVILGAEIMRYRKERGY